MSRLGAGRAGLEVRALSWSAFSSIGGAIITLARSAVLSRLLAPDDFGIFGLATFALAAAATFTDLGLGRFALVGKFSGEHEERRFLNTAWTVQVARGVVLMVAMASASGLYAAVTHEPRLSYVLAASSASLLLTSLASPGSILLYRQLEQRALALVRVGSDLLGLLVTAAIAWRTPSPWALVAGLFISTTIGTALSYAAHPYRPRFAWDGALFARGFAQGRHVAVVTALTFVTTQVDNLVVGGLLGAAPLGLYLFAYRISALPVEHAQAIVSAVALPRYVRHRAEGARVLGSHLVAIVSPATVVLCAGLLPAFVLRRQAVLLLGGTRWEAAAALLGPLFLLALLRSTSIHLGTFLQAAERAELDSRAKIFEAALFVPGCVLFVHLWGLMGASWAGALTYGVAVIQRTLAAGRVLPGETGSVALAWARPASVAIAFAVASLFGERAGISPFVNAPLVLVGFIGVLLLAEPQLVHRLNGLLGRSP